MNKEEIKDEKELKKRIIEIMGQLEDSIETFRIGIEKVLIAVVNINELIDKASTFPPEYRDRILSMLRDSLNSFCISVYTSLGIPKIRFEAELRLVKKEEGEEE